CSLWMNLWNLWIACAAGTILLPERQRWCPASGACQHGHMDDTGVPQAAIEQVPSAFDDADDARVLLDVREDDEWRTGHAPGARHIPMGDVPARMAEIPGDAELFVVCHAG